ncbi:Mitochondrial outer membrane translocase complex subunit Tom22 [Penicillium samsonianum]|uniref:Mitochondrial outer membrane translocase complex subunit Tom22 n=1 Tax=Penicillium samsonianum TaxID=1882272 RepID=UPI0025487729|nr:Mitochondrial outer membrane translocase complex subunit Tom22 [Penicillium samsonianum]KAJ6143513.1 Mitochondrial outer membrane translocase complex subunit Tom22 [Penicillium samsonianum]
MTSLSVGPSSSPLFGKKVGAKPERPPIIQPSPLTRPPSSFPSKPPKMVKLTEVEDEHFTDKPTATKHDALLASDDEDDYSDTDSEISDDEDVELEAESLYERVAALKDMIPPSARRTVTSTVSSITDLTKASFSFSGKALWVISTSAFLLGVPFALAYAEEEQYIQMEREQGMIKGANEMLTPGTETEKVAQPTL